MRLIALSSALLISLPVIDASALAGQTSDALKVRSSQSMAADPGARGNSFADSPFHTRLLTALAGGAVGAGLGFFASQVVTGDWDEQEVDRGAWSAVGGSIGLALGFSFPIGGRSAAPRSSRSLQQAPPITPAEMSGTGVNTAYDAVELLRPQWLKQRGFQVIGEQPSERIQVYLEDMHLGGIAKLRDVSARDIESIRFLDAAAATYRWGAGHNHGAIMIVSEGHDSG